MKNIVVLFMFFYIAAYADIEMNFIVDNYYLIGHTLSHNAKKNSDILAFKEEVKKHDLTTYKILLDYYKNDSLTIESCHDNNTIPFMKWVTNLPSFQKILKITQEYKNECQQNWLKDYEITSKYVKEITGMQLDGKYDIYI
jgi:hypothetical protein